MTDVKIRNKPLFQAMVEGIQQEMERDPRVICMGEDVGKMGGVFQSTAGLHKKFPDRVLDTPISETAIMGAALGAAASGLRPIAELMFVDFMGVCFGQIMNEIGKATYMSGGAVRLPLVITASTGGGFSDAAPALADPARPVRARAGPQGGRAIQSVRCERVDDHRHPRR